MIVNTRDTSSINISGVILIDCWEPNGSQGASKIESLQKFYESLRNNLSLLNPDVVVDATVYYEGAGLSEILVPWVNSYPNFRCTDPEEFKIQWRRLRKFKNIKLKNWLVVGLEWGICAHNNKLGLNSLARLANQNKINFFGADWGFWKWDSPKQWLNGNCNVTVQHYINDFLTWQICKKGYYRLMDIDEIKWRQVCQQYIDLDSDRQ
jgi:hypothetical protein